MKMRKFFNWFSPEGKSVKHRLFLSAFTFIMLAFASIALGLMSLYFATGAYKFELYSFYIQQPKLILLNVLPFVLVSFFVWFVSNRAWVGFLVSSILCIAYSFPDYWKLIARDDPVYAEDLVLIKEAAQMSDEYVSVTWQMYLAIALVIVGCIVLALFAKGKMLHFSLRIALPIAILISLIPLYTSVYTSDEVYNSFTAWSRLNPLFENTKYVSRGGIYPFLYSIKTAVPKAPEGYDEKESRTLIDSYQNDMIPEDKKVNVMVVMYEAFADLSTCTDIITGEDPYKDFHSIQAESYHGKLVANVFAGGTYDTERTVMTGFSNLTSFRRKSWSYPRYFADNGYYVYGSHAGNQAFYNRNNVNRNLGFADYKFIENYYKDICAGVPWDNVFMPEITRMFIEDIKSGENVFTFNVTYQNHGPYSKNLPENVKEYVPRGNLSESDHAIINNYLRGVESTAHHMKNAIEQARNLEEPVVMVFFGDHKPSLGDFGTTYSALGIDVTSSSEVTFYNYYSTEYLIWANDSAKKILGNDFLGEGPVISSCYLMNVLFEQCGWDGPSYLKFSNEVRERMPVVTTLNRIVADGKLVQEIQLSESDRLLLSKFRKAQYYLARDILY